MAHANSVRFGMKLTPEQQQKIKRLAEREGTSAEEAVMALVEKALGAEAPVPQPGSFLEAVQDLVGSVGTDEDPVDLASNPAHLEGFGR